jgi:beta-glucosidase
MLDGHDFTWFTGFECSFIPQIGCDQYAWTQHDAFWRDDLRRVREELGLRALRYGIPWHRVELAPGVFEWREMDERLQIMADLGITPIVDLVHFGTPLWVRGSFAHPDVGARIAEWSAAFARRYRELVRCYTIVNEPFMTAKMGGLLGSWPPRLRGEANFLLVLRHLLRGIHEGTQAVRAQRSDAVFVHVEVAGHRAASDPGDERLVRWAERENHLRMLSSELLCGRVGEAHPLWEWLLENGMDREEIARLGQRATPDVVGLDYYAHVDVEGVVVGERIVERRASPPAGLGRVARMVWEATGVPVAVTETDCVGSAARRIAWLETTVAAVAQARAEGVPVVGYGWWPAMSHVDWHAWLRRYSGRVNGVGLYDLRRDEKGTLVRRATPVVKRYAELAVAGAPTG